MLYNDAALQSIKRGLQEMLRLIENSMMRVEYHQYNQFIVHFCYHKYSLFRYTLNIVYPLRNYYYIKRLEQ